MSSHLDPLLDRPVIETKSFVTENDTKTLLQVGTRSYDISLNKYWVHQSK